MNVIAHAVALAAWYSVAEAAPITVRFPEGLASTSPARTARSKATRRRAAFAGGRVRARASELLVEGSHS